MCPAIEMVVEEAKSKSEREKACWRQLVKFGVSIRISAEDSFQNVFEIKYTTIPNFLTCSDCMRRLSGPAFCLERMSSQNNSKNQTISNNFK